MCRRSNLHTTNVGIASQKTLAMTGWLSRYLILSGNDMRIQWKLLIGALILLPILAHLVYAIVVSPMADYYITVDQYVMRSADSPMRVGGVVVPGSIRWDNATRTLRFQIAGERATMTVMYRALAPDALRDQVTAIVDGARAPDGTFLATSVRVRCPHQYLPAGW